MNLELLQEIGLTRSEVNVYLALLELGSSTTGPIVDKSGASSSKIYEILERLIKKGLVNYVHEGNTKHYEAANPERIVDYLEEKEKQISKQKQEVSSILPELKLKQTLSKHKSDAAIYRGMKGLETVFYETTDTLKKGDTIYVSGVPKRSEAVNRFFIKWNKYREKKGIWSHIIFDESARDDPQTFPENSPNTLMKFFPAEVETPAAINIFNDRVVIFPSETEREPLLIVIKDQDVVKSFRAQFDIQWNQQTRTYTGIEGPRIVFREIKNGKGEVMAFGLDYEKINTELNKEVTELIDALDKDNRKDRLIFSNFKNYRLAKQANVRILPEEYFSPLHVEIYGDKVAVIDWSEPITTVIFDKKEVADSYKKYFELLWKIAKQDILE